jgi:hypothetical protein
MHEQAAKASIVTEEHWRTLPTYCMRCIWNQYGTIIQYYILLYCTECSVYILLVVTPLAISLTGCSASLPVCLRLQYLT